MKTLFTMICFMKTDFINIKTSINQKIPFKKMKWQAIG